MTDVFKDFLVVIESADGTRRGSLTRYNASQERQGYEDCAHLEMRTTTPRRKRR